MVPFKEGECVTCHHPHTSEYPKLLAKRGNLLCFDCHKEKSEKVAVNHAPVTSEKGCLSCHPPHAAKNKNLLNTKDASSMFFLPYEDKRSARSLKFLMLLLSRRNVIHAIILMVRI